MIPPGPPGETYKSLGDIEPRTPIKSLPFTIDQPGSYYLTGDMSYPDPTQDGIKINASNVSIDMMGFTISGPLPGSGNLYSAISVKSAQSNITIQNGKIVDWGGLGVDCDSTSNTKIVKIDVNRTGDYGICGSYSSQIIDCNVSYSQKIGIYSGYNCLVKNCNVKNCDEGIHGNYYNRVIDCGAYNNITNGIYVRNGSVVQNCASNNNGGNGIYISGTGASTVIGCTTSGNDGSGIGGSEAVILRGDKEPEPGAPAVTNRVAGNIMDCTAEDNGGDGFEVGAGSNVQRCLAKANGSNGIEISEPVFLSLGELEDSYSQIKDCICYGNDGNGIRIFQYVVVIGNTCSLNASGIYVTSESGPITSPESKGAISFPGNGNRIEGNSVVQNTSQGIYVPANSHSLVIKNWAYGNNVDYSIGAGNLAGPEVTSDLATNDNAHANFAYPLPK
jgi:parallel beta-helix repeat protein